MRRLLLSAVVAVASATAAMAQDTLWVQYDNRFADNKFFALSSKVDSVEFCLTGLNIANPYPILKLYNSSLTKGYSEYRISSLVNCLAELCSRTRAEYFSSPLPCRLSIS